MTANRIRPRIAARDLVAAGARLFGTIVLDLADMTTGPAVYLPRLAAFATLDGEQLGDDDGSLLVLVQPGEALDLITRHGTPGRAAVALTAELRMAGVL